MKTFVIFLPIILLCTSKVIADGKRYTYSYDPSGNILRRNIVLQNRRLPDINYQNIGSEESPSVTADDIWSDVFFVIPNEIHEGDMLLIHTPNGLLVRSVPILQSEFHINLSGLHRGAYLFTFRMTGKISNVKMNKRK